MLVPAISESDYENRGCQPAGQGTLDYTKNGHQFIQEDFVFKKLSVLYNV